MTETLKTSNRDDAELSARLARWLTSRPELSGSVTLDHVERPDANGMSSDTLLFDASWDGPDGTRVAGRYVMRLQPADDACPIFPTYDLDAQARVMRLVGERSSAPVPTVRWSEDDPGVLGAPFFVMDRVDGRVPPDVLPYPFDGSWVQAATPVERDELQERSLAVLADIHQVRFDPSEVGFLAPRSLTPDGADTADGGDGAPRAGVAGRDKSDERSLLRRHVDREREFYEWACDGLRFPLLERTFDWLERHWPNEAEQTAPVVCWGDARIGNIVYDGFTPVGVLDWEMATLGPREVDLGWFIFLHRFFDEITTDLGMAGLPDFLARDWVVTRYTELTGHEPRDLAWFEAYAALRHGTVMTRAMRRRVLFGEIEMPDDPEELILHRAALERICS